MKNSEFEAPVVQPALSGSDRVEPAACSKIDWQAPWLKPYRTLGSAIAQQMQGGRPVYEALNEVISQNPHFYCPIRFVPQEHAQGAAAYEAFIFETKTVPTRDNLHDFFNGLVWLHFPKIKTKLNELQAQAIAKDGVTTTRGKLRDALTLLDENAAFLLESNSKSPLLRSIRNKAWQQTFVLRRADWAKAEVIVFGHALLEKLVTPRKAITAHVYCPMQPIGALQDVDLRIAAQLDPGHLASKPFAPLPVLGVPHWCKDNEDAGFYADPDVFRPKN